MHFKLRSFAVGIITLSILFSFILLFHLYYYYNSLPVIITGQQELQRTDSNKRHYRGEVEKEVQQQGCETIHIALIVGGYNATKSTAILLKSLLFYRSTPLHLHITADHSAQLILTTLLQSWSLPSLNYTLYPITHALIESVQWIPNAHYSSVYGLLKLLFPYILLDINHVIVLDTDLTILSDLVELWKHFKELRKQGKWLGLVENQSNWYSGTLWKDYKPWPALDHGFNTGVMLMDLQTMRNNYWNNTWVTITNQTLPEYKYTSLADQDIINTVIKTYPDIIYTLPCSWNIQLSEHTQSDLCFLKRHQYHIIHWNSPLKTQLSNQYTPYFVNLHTAFVQYDGNLYRNTLLKCPHEKQQSYNNNNNNNENVIDSLCSSFLYETSTSYRTHLYYFGQSYQPYDEHDITLITQLSIDRIQNIHTIIRHWEGPITLVLYCTDSDLYEISNYFNFFPSFTKRRNIGVHIVYKQGQFYPINFLRNIGLQYSTTPYVFLTDIDFLPAFNMYNYLREAIKVLKLDTFKRALVVPAFEFLQYRYEFPNSKSTLLKMLKNSAGSSVQEFRHSIWNSGHSATNYQKWYKAKRPYKVNWSSDYEPYIAVQRNITKYDQRFLGFGWNKVSHIMELYAQNYEFIVLPDAFMIHSPHSPSRDIMKYRSRKEYRKCLNKIKASFISRLVEKYGEKARKMYERYYQ